MKKLIILFLVCSFVSCLPDHDETPEKSDSLQKDAQVDTFSVRKPEMSAEDLKEALKEKQDNKEMISDAAALLTEAPAEPAVRFEVEAEPAIVTNPDVPPSFPGGEQAMRTYIEKHRIYPLVAFQNEIKGEVVVQFYVESDGKIVQTKVLKKLGYGCDEAAEDLITGMPRWIPGKKNGKNVKCSRELAIRFGD